MAAGRTRLDFRSEAQAGDKHWGPPSPAKAMSPVKCAQEGVQMEKERSQNDPGVRRRDAPSKQTKGAASSGGAERNGALLGKAA